MLLRDGCEVWGDARKVVPPLLLILCAVPGAPSRATYAAKPLVVPGLVDPDILPPFLRRVYLHNCGWVEDHGRRVPFQRRTLDKFRGNARFSTWLYCIAYACLPQACRKKSCRCSGGNAGEGDLLPAPNCGINLQLDLSGGGRILPDSPVDQASRNNRSMGLSISLHALTELRVWFKNWLHRSGQG